MVMFRNCAALFAGISLILTSAPALAGAKITYSAYEGPASVKTGEGGTKITKNGIDYWTSGTPPRQYEVIGMVQDRRDEAWMVVMPLEALLLQKKCERPVATL